jgi:hypothetical protein
MRQRFLDKLAFNLDACISDFGFAISFLLRRIIAVVFGATDPINRSTRKP